MVTKFVQWTTSRYGNTTAIFRKNDAACVFQKVNLSEMNQDINAQLYTIKILYFKFLIVDKWISLVSTSSNF